MARQIVTQDQIIQLLAEGACELRVDADAIITDVAAELAQDRGLRIIRGTDTVSGAPSTRSTPTPASQSSGAVPPPRDEVRRAVVAALGVEPEQLDAVLDRVLEA
ncbi:MAG: hypothetical protein Q4D89_10565 [Arachnia propionica]|uniref:hypothetical protein n=1 Tax=Arachnia propionica TaxID=1750 RepID=UPI0026FA7C68|nr:hypothetical protein [Arachnia propionica]